MKKYIVPQTDVMAIQFACVFCNVSSVSNEEAQDNVQLAPGKKKGWLY